MFGDGVDISLYAHSPIELVSLIHGSLNGSSIRGAEASGASEAWFLGVALSMLVQISPSSLWQLKENP